MSIDVTTEKRFESDIEEFILSPAGGYTHNQDAYDSQLGVYKDTLLRFIQKTQPKEWKRFLLQNKVDPERKFCLAFNNACDMDGLISVLRHGFKHRGIPFKVCYFKPESGLNQTAMSLYEENEITCNRQWFYSNDTHNSVDMVLAVNGIPVFALELKNQYTGQNVDHAKRQWMYDRDPREICFQFNKRILGYFCIDQLEVWMTTKLEGKNTYFLPFNQGSNGAGKDGGKGNPANPNGYPTAYFWEYVFQKDSMMDIIQKFIHLQIKEEKKRLPDDTEQVTKKKTLIFPRYHQLDVVRKLIADVREEGSGHNYLIQHSAGSGKSNSIAWTAYRLASLHDANDISVFSSVIVVTDRTVLDAQLQETISGFDHTIGAVETIDDKKNSKNLRDAINNGARIIVTTLQKFPVIYQEVDKVAGRNFAIIVDEAHSSQTGSSAMKLKATLADTEAALREYAEIEGKAEDEIDRNDKLVQEMLTHGKHPNLSFFAFTATPKPATLEMFGSQWTDGSFHPFHIYSMRQAIEEGFILDVLQNYMTYFLRQFNGILEQVGIKNTITNFFAYNTKREIVGQVKDTDAFKSCYADTISCSHPCLARYNKKGSKEYPVNCGYCYPCLIRKSSLLDIDEIKKYSYQGEAYDFLIEYEESEKSADLRAVLGSIYRCKHSSDKELKRYIRCVGELTEEEVEKFLSLYKKSIEDLVQLFSADQRMKEYLGL